MLKHGGPDRHLKPVNLKCYLADTKICPVEVLDTYLKATKKIRKSETKLLSFFETTQCSNCKNNINVDKRGSY